MKKLTQNKFDEKLQKIVEKAQKLAAQKDKLYFELEALKQQAVLSGIKNETGRANDIQEIEINDLMA